MQAVIDQQQTEINQQKQALESQQQALADQQKMLETLQTQLNALAGETPVSEEDQSEADGHIVADNVQISIDPASDQPSTRYRWTPTDITSDKPYLLLDTHPLDIPDHRGVILHSEDGHKFLRIYGSVRGLAVYDNRQNFHPYDLNIPQVPFGEDDVRDWNQEWTINTSRLGLQFHMEKYLGGRIELDWKGESGDAIRIRHMFVRSAHWLIGKHWTVMDTITFLPLSIDAHSTGTAIGIRQPVTCYRTLLATLLIPGPGGLCA